MRTALNTPLGKTDIGWAIKPTNTGKAPGNDELSIEFYQHYVEFLCAPPLAMYSEAFETGVLLALLREANIAVHPKSGRDPTDCESYRLLSIINVDAKILGKVLAHRLAKVAGEFIHTDQAGFVGGRTITTNIRKAFLIMEQTEKEEETCALASLDTHKAFDTVHWVLMEHMLPPMT
ncbi:hypothetical protein NDU88_009301 [Pleurodeles waltl]|uniref:Reverse transcriptase domain-containing protein n=1 Tax=Pleurodeles waltl TaxID=8319 RepID=A0AAV7PUI7_PLEWA|nr:hypothetical protein NDU88_009301 [Pleurodeles waltl]